MLNWALVFFIFAVIAAVVGAAGIASIAVGIAQLSFFAFLVLFMASLFFGRRVLT